jgi:hypothetical protein
MEKEEILQKIREENASAYMDERERSLRLREDSFALGIGLLLALVLFIVKVFRGQPAADLLSLITGMSAAGFVFRCVKNRKKADIFWACLCTLLTLLYLWRFFMGAA